MDLRPLRPTAERGLPKPSMGAPLAPASVAWPSQALLFCRPGAHVEK